MAEESARLYGLPLDFVPGSQYRYTNSGCLLLMTTPNLNNYAMGLLVRDVGGPDTEVTVAVLANINGNAPQQIAMALATAATSR